MFKVGDVIIGKPGAPYAWTGPGTKNEVLETGIGTMGPHLISVKCLNNGITYFVDPKYFALPDTNETGVLLLNQEEE